VRDAADNARRPLGRAAFSDQDRDGHDTEFAERDPGAFPARGELAAPLVRRPLDDCRLLREERGMRRV
jgi:hypothetical protein